MEKGRAETDNYQDKGDDNDAFDKHGRVMIEGKIFSILVY
jgi:hypothetical protein